MFCGKVHEFLLFSKLLTLLSYLLIVLILLLCSSFQNINALKYSIQSGLDSLEASRRRLLDQLLEVDQTMEKPRDEDVERVRYCPNCYVNVDGRLCVHCEMDELFQVCVDLLLNHVTG